MTRVLIVCTDVVGARMAGGGIRSFELARALARHGAVTLAAQGEVREEVPFEFVPGTASNVRAALAAADVVIAQPVALRLFPEIARADAARVIDLYDPTPIEALEIHRELAAGARAAAVEGDVGDAAAAALAGDYFICASDRQRKFWLGLLAAAGRLSPALYDADPTFRRLLDVVPFGHPDQAPEHHGRALRGVVPGIGEDDRVVLWAGGMWNWFDPVTLVEAAALARGEVPNLRVVFGGGGHPNPAVPRMRAAAEALAAARRLGVEGEHVFFLAEWVPYRRRADLLLEADIGISLHRAGVETEFAFRTRILDYLWTARPIIATSGDTLSELVASAGLGIVVEPGDAAGLAGAITSLCSDRALRERCSARSAEVAAGFTWSRVVEPLANYVRAPYRTTSEALRPGFGGRRSLLRKAAETLRGEGPAALWRRASRHLARRWG